MGFFRHTKVDADVSKARINLHGLFVVLDCLVRPPRYCRQRESKVALGALVTREFLHSVAPNGLLAPVIAVALPRGDGKERGGNDAEAQRRATAQAEFGDDQSAGVRGVFDRGGGGVPAGCESNRGPAEFGHGWI